jgi:hypothetical protein
VKASTFAGITPVSMHAAASPEVVTTERASSCAAFLTENSGTFLDVSA